LLLFFLFTASFARYYISYSAIRLSSCKCV